MTESLERREVLWRIVKMLEIQRKGVKELDWREGGAPAPRFNSGHVHLLSQEVQMHHRAYPSNYFDPYPDSPPVQCEQCGDWVDHQDASDVHEVPDLIGFILQGTCHKCEEPES